MWFQQLTGFQEESAEQVRNNLVLKNGSITSKVNGKTYHCGQLEIPTLNDLRSKSLIGKANTGTLKISEIVGNVQDLHKHSENSGAFFQAASQFNLLEMVNPNITPDEGIDRYEFDYTQGPACAIACGAGTIYRNYFAEVNGLPGQTKNNQIDCLKDIGLYFNNKELQLWKMKNGYALANRQGLKYISSRIKEMDIGEYEALKGKLRIGIQWDTEVTINNNQQRVTQAYCSALPVAYSQVNEMLWQDFAVLILEAAYEASFHAALINAQKTGNPKVYLTLLGGGAFGNRHEWIEQAILKVLDIFRNSNLEVKMASYGHPDPMVSELISKYYS